MEQMVHNYKRRGHTEQIVYVYSIDTAALAHPKPVTLTLNPNLTLSPNPKPYPNP